MDGSFIATVLETAAVYVLYLAWKNITEGKFFCLSLVVVCRLSFSRKSFSWAFLYFTGWRRCTLLGGVDLHPSFWTLMDGDVDADPMSNRILGRRGVLPAVIVDRAVLRFLFFPCVRVWCRVLFRVVLEGVGVVHGRSRCLEGRKAFGFSVHCFCSHPPALLTLLFVSSLVLVLVLVRWSPPLCYPNPPPPLHSTLLIPRFTRHASRFILRSISYIVFLNLKTFSPILTGCCCSCCLSCFLHPNSQFPFFILIPHSRCFNSPPSAQSSTSASTNTYISHILVYPFRSFAPGLVCGGSCISPCPLLSLPFSFSFSFAFSLT